MKINSKKILNELKRRSWRQWQLASAMKISPQAISILLKRQTARLSTINKMGVALEMDAKDLMI